MSLNEKKRQNELPDIYLTEGICRSKSFGGLSHRRTNSADATFASSKVDVSFDGSLTKTFYSGIGSTVSPNSTMTATRNLSLSTWINALKNSRTSRLNKSPQPERTQIIFDSICKGLKDTIMLVQNEISNSRLTFDNISVSSVTSQGRLYEFEKQMKANERYLKKLEFHLAKLEELKDQYDVQHRIRDGIRAMGYAYILSPGKLKEAALQSVKSEFKESTEIMNTYENNLESLMGTLLFEMIGIQGFARICSGDIFEVVIKHGDQKWKSRGRVVKNGEQIWENKSFLFKSLFNEPLCIKAVEVRGLGKNILLGNKVCETRDLFCAHPQQMTINLNPSGSLKLNLIITWHPLDSVQDGVFPIQMSYSVGRNCRSLLLMQESEQFSELSSTPKQSTHQSPTFCDSSDLSFSGDGSNLLAQASALGHSNSDMTEAYHSVDCDAAHCSPSCLKRNRTNVLPTNCNLNDSQTWSIALSEENSDVHSISSSNTVNLTEVMKSLRLSLNDVPDCYSEIAEFSPLLEDLSIVLKGKESSTSDSNVSISVESALGCFDFLNTAIENEEQDTSSDRISEDSERKSIDQGREMTDLEKHLLKLDISSLLLSSKNEELDTVLTEHLLYCLKLASSLVGAGPFKCLETFTLMKLKVQQYCISSILEAIKQSDFSIDNFFEENELAVKQLWTSICGNALCTTANHLSLEMESVLRAKTVLDNYMASTVSPRLICDILDCDIYNPAQKVSVFHFKSFFSNHSTPDSLLLEYVADSLAAEDLKCRDVQKAFCAVSVLSKIVPSPYSLFHLGCLLMDSNVDLKNIAVSYLRAVSTSEELNQKVISSYLKMLQSENVTYRLVSCKALDVLEAKHCIVQLIYIMNEDADANVRDAARNVLLNIEEMMKHGGPL